MRISDWSSDVCSSDLWTIILPLLTPTLFFLIVVNMTYAFFETFGVIHATTRGGPAKATEILVYKVWYDGFEAQDLGGSAAQSAILMAIVIVLTVMQFRSEEHTSELQSLMRISYAVFCLNKKILI